MKRQDNWTAQGNQLPVEAVRREIDYFSRLAVDSLKQRDKYPAFSVVHMMSQARFDCYTWAAACLADAIGSAQLISLKEYYMQADGRRAP